MDRVHEPNHVVRRTVRLSSTRLSSMLRLFCLALFITGSASAQTRATADDGRTVWLHDDGTWSATPPDEIVVDFDAIETAAPPSPAPPPPPMPARTVTGGGGVYEIRYDASRWTRSASLEDEAEYGYELPFGAGYGLVIYELTPFPISTMRQIVLDNVRAVADGDVEVIREGPLKKDQYQIEFAFTLPGGLEMRMTNTMHTDPRGTLQVITSTSEALADRFADELARFQRGVRFLPDGG